MLLLPLLVYAVNLNEISNTMLICQVDIKTKDINVLPCSTSVILFSSELFIIQIMNFTSNTPSYITNM